MTTYFILQRFISPIVILTKTAQKISSGNLELNDELLKIDSNDEVGKLSSAFRDMSIKLSISYNDLKKLNESLELKVEERTEELQASKELIERTHKNIKDSINYASIIQEAILPEKDLLKRYFRDCFVFWQPRDSVGGDIYFIREIDEDSVILMVIDGAGHGIPGAFVTMLVKAIETQMITDLSTQQLELHPSNILEYFNIALKVMLKQGRKSRSRAGFDGGVLYYNRAKQVCKYAGAKTPLYIIRDGEMEIIKSDRANVGFPRTKIEQEYTEYDIDIENGAELYIATDGIIDQEGADGSRFGKKELQNLIQTISDNRDMNGHSDIIKSTLKSFQGDKEQSDDITIVGIKI
jgi:serine phosphatase RsbU (regulator of sigma subunit)